MFAVFRTGGKQYLAHKDTVLNVEKLAGEVGDLVTFDDVLLCESEAGVLVGTPNVPGVVVTAQIIEQKRGPKLIIFKKQRRHGKQLKKGHRQSLTRVKILDFTNSGAGSNQTEASAA